MGKLRFYIYKLSTSPGMLELAIKRGIHAEWIVEAGCHDGSDTLKFAAVDTVRKVYAYEPDPIARAIAIKRVSGSLQGEKVEIYPYALVEKKQTLTLLSNGGQLGTGSSQVLEPSKIEKESSYSIEGRRLDEVLIPHNNQGLLWLDVEGGALDAIEGARGLMNQFRLIQIEVEFQNMWGRRKKNYKDVIRFLNKQDFLLMYAPVSPGLFGDLTFVRREEASFMEKVRSLGLRIVLTLLHSIIFPITHPRK
jgi:FkbM family methyltransferase